MLELDNLFLFPSKSNLPQSGEKNKSISTHIIYILFHERNNLNKSLKKITLPYYM
jgi:hypothetical protein